MPLIMLTLLHNASLKAGKVVLATRRQHVINHASCIFGCSACCLKQSTELMRRLICNVKSPDEAGRVQNFRCTIFGTGPSQLHACMTPLSTGNYARNANFACEMVL